MGWLADRSRENCGVPTKVAAAEIATIVRALRFTDVEVGLDEHERALLTKLTS